MLSGPKRQQIRRRADEHGGQMRARSHCFLLCCVVTERLFPPRGHVDGAAAASAGFQAASPRTLIASAFRPPSYRSLGSSRAPSSSKRPRLRHRASRLCCGVSSFSAEVSGVGEPDTMSYTLWNRKQLERPQRWPGAAPSPCFRALSAPPELLSGALRGYAR